MRRCLSHDPSEQQQKILQSFLDRQEQRFHRNGADPWAILANNDDAKQKLASKIPSGFTAADVAAWTAVARVILNLDETITKE